MNIIIDLQNTIDLQNVEEYQELPSQEQILTWVQCALDSAAFDRDSAEITVRIVDEPESQQLNNCYRHKNKPTNILSFPFEVPPQITSDLLGDLVVCLPVVTREAKEQGKVLVNHWAHMIIHGTLHLIGFDHIHSEDANAMESLEVSILAQLNVPDPYHN